MEHARLSASGAKKWLNCPKSIYLEQQFPNTSSLYVEEGTTAHKLAQLKIELYLKEISQQEYNKSIKSLNISDDMEGYIDEYRDYIIERFNTLKTEQNFAELYSEFKLDYSDWVPGGFGTGDIVLITNDKIEIIDLKYGAGVKVEAINNPQLMLYGLGAYAMFRKIIDVSKISLTVYQPRIDHISSHELDLSYLIEFGEFAKTRAKLVDNELAECVVGTHCDDGFCRARPLCKAYNSKNTSVIEKYSYKHPDLISDNELIDILHQLDTLCKWTKIIKSYALNTAIKGKKYEGFKVVEGRSIRKFIDNPFKVAESLKSYGLAEDEIYKISLNTLTDIEKRVGKKTFNEKFKDLVVKTDGAPILVEISDKRKELNSLESESYAFDIVLQDIEN